ncbi:MAG: isochorismatase family cysteine hydrolase [Actinomycetes bacterium]
MSDFEIDPKTTALLIQDLQNDVVSEGGAWADSGAPGHAASQGLIEHVSALAAACRAKGIPVIHMHYIVEAGAPGLKLNAPIFQGIVEVEALVRGSWGAAPADGVEPQPGDFTLEKMRVNGFHGTKLEVVLTGLNVETLMITGAWTNMSIESTARYAGDAGYRVVVVTDGTSTISDDWQHAAIDYALTNIALRESTGDIIAAINR